MTEWFCVCLKLAFDVCFSFMSVLYCFSLNTLSALLSQMFATFCSLNLSLFLSCFYLMNWLCLLWPALLLFVYCLKDKLMNKKSNLSFFFLPSLSSFLFLNIEVSPVLFIPRTDSHSVCGQHSVLSKLTNYKSSPLLLCTTFRIFSVVGGTQDSLTIT